jgi:hypothetical protein
MRWSADRQRYRVTAAAIGARRQRASALHGVERPALQGFRRGRSTDCDLSDRGAAAPGPAGMYAQEAIETTSSKPQRRARSAQGGFAVVRRGRASGGSRGVIPDRAAVRGQRCGAGIAPCKRER